MSLDLATAPCAQQRNYWPWWNKIMNINIVLMLSYFITPIYTVMKYENMLYCIHTLEYIYITCVAGFPGIISCLKLFKFCELIWCMIFFALEVEGRQRKIRKILHEIWFTLKIVREMWFALKIVCEMWFAPFFQCEVGFRGGVGRPQSVGSLKCNNKGGNMTNFSLFYER